MTENRPGLSEIAYRAGTHPDFVTAMLAALASKTMLSRLRTRMPDDPTIALLDAWAVACDVLTFYTERLANESYLRTATDRTSLQELGKLIAFRLNPGVAAQTRLAFTLQRPPGTPAALTPDPGTTPPVLPTAVTLPVGLRVQSVPGPDELPQTFETVAAIEARPEWNSLPVARTTSYAPYADDTEAWVTNTDLKPGDTVLLVNDFGTAVRTLTSAEAGHLQWRETLEDSYNYLFVLRKRISVFGHNAPVWRAMNNEFRVGYATVHEGATPGQAEWPNFTVVLPLVDLDGSHPDVVAGSWAVVAGTAYQVASRTERSRSEFGVAGPVTRLTLDEATGTVGSPREVVVFAVSEPLERAKAPKTSPVDGDKILVEGDATGMLAGREIVVADDDHAEVCVVASTCEVEGGYTDITLAAALTECYDRATCVVFGNVAKATHGETVHQILGSGDARRTFQHFPTQHEPLTYVQADNAEGAASTMSVTVNDVPWSEMRTLFGTAPTNRVYTLTPEPDGPVVTEFGDGVHGARLPSGSQNVRATYRKGLGTLGNLDTEKISLPLDRPLGLTAATNPVPATGGVDPEPESHARQSMPLPVRALGRAVSLRDYADFALAFTGISLADATVLSVHGRRTIVVTVAGPDRAPAPASTVQNLTSALRKAGDPHVRVVVLPHRTATFHIGLKVRLAAPVTLADVEAALRAAFSAQARGFAEPVHRSGVIAVAANVPGVLAVDLDLLYRDEPGLADRLLAESARLDEAGYPVAAELLSLSPDPFDSLEALP